MLQSLGYRFIAVASLGLVGSGAMAANIAIDTTNASNGLTGIYSASFDPPLSPCGGGSPSYCSFFGGDPTSGAVLVTPTPSGVINAVPGGIGPLGIPVQPVPASGSFLDLTLTGGNTSLTLGAGSSISFGDVAISIPSVATTANASGAGMVFVTGGTTSVDVNGQAEFLINPSPGLAVDFSRFSQVVTSCSGGACALITADILNLDMVRYRLFIDFDPTFTSFTGSFIGQTANNSIVYATLNSAVVPVPAAVWLLGSALAALVGLRRRALAS
jgi:hypothetical protein